MGKFEFIFRSQEKQVMEFESERELSDYIRGALDCECFATKEVSGDDRIQVFAGGLSRKEDPDLLFRKIS